MAVSDGDVGVREWAGADSGKSRGDICKTPPISAFGLSGQGGGHEHPVTPPPPPESASGGTADE